tara:strand:+ start:43260 stop:44201 length:942 start_codon:yes stop_codon:yes gene_type:complete
MRSFIFIICFLIFPLSLFAQETPVMGKHYRATTGESIYMPIGKISFADRVIDFKMGTPHAPEEFSNPEEALGEPDYVHYKVPRYISLGCGGQITLEFTDNGFVDMEGPDLYVWEVGPSEESFQFEISKDGQNWIDLGIIEGGKSYIDIAPVVSDVRDVFYFVRITDIKSICSGNTPGADIDAVGTISGVLKINLSADVLFDVARHNLKNEAKEAIEELANRITQIGMAEIIVQGHTDSDGDELYNLRLSKQRAKSVLERLENLLSDRGMYEIKTEAYGLTRPRATNETEEGKQLNRRVELIVLPHRDFYKKSH